VPRATQDHPTTSGNDHLNNWIDVVPAGLDQAAGERLARLMTAGGELTGDERKVGWGRSTSCCLPCLGCYVCTMLEERACSLW
jgi:hypothetical protein